MSKLDVDQITKIYGLRLDFTLKLDQNKIESNQEFGSLLVCFLVEELNDSNLSGFLVGCSIVY